MDIIGSEGKETSYSAQQRILDLYQRFIQGEKINLDTVAVEYQKHKETIKEDIRTIRTFLEKRYQNIVYDKRGRYYYLNSLEGQLNKSEIVMILLHLYHSRSLTKAELLNLETKLSRFLSRAEQKQLNLFFQSFKYHFNAFQKEELLPKLGVTFQAILEQRMVKIHYYNGHLTERIIKPLTIAYHDATLYVVAHLHEKDYPMPAKFRMDRISQCELLKEKFCVSQGANYFKPGEFMNKSFMMFGGEPVKVILKLIHWLEEYVYRAFPHAVKLGAENDSIVMEIEVLGVEGILYWILSQQERVEVIEPLELKAKVITSAKNIISVYEINP